MEYSAEFDLDLEYGQEGEGLVKWLIHELAANRIEVKRDRKLQETGNVYIEYFCRGKPSGIDVTKSRWWAEVLPGEGYGDEVVVLIKSDRLRRLCYPYKNTKRDTAGGDNDLSRGILLPCEELVRKVNMQKLQEIKDKHRDKFEERGIFND